MAIQKHNAYYQSESGLYFYDEYGEKQDIEVNADSWKKYSDEHGSSGSKIYIGEGNSAYNGSVEIGSNNLGYNGGTILGDDNSAYNGSTIIGDSNWAVNGGGIFGENNIGGKGGFVIGNDNKVKVWDNNTSSYKDVKQENVLDSSKSVYNYMLPNQIAIGYNNNVNHGRGQYIGTWTLTPFQIGSYNEVLDSLSGYSMPSDGIGAAIYNIGKANSSVNAGVNIGGDNLILTGDETVGASINIGKKLVNRYGILIGQYLSSNGYSFNIGQYSTTETGAFNFGTNNYVNAGSFAFGSNVLSYVSFGVGRSITSYNGSFNFGERNYASYGSYCIGKDITADNGSFNFGTNNTAGQGSMVLGESAFANRGSFCINKTGIGITGGNKNLASTADYGSMAIGCGNTAYSGGYAIGGKQSACGNSVAIGIKGNSNVAEQLSLAIGFNNSATQNSMVVGEGNTACCHSYIFGADNSAATQAVIVGLGNKDYVSNLNSQGEWINFFGRYNSVEGDDGTTGKNYQYNIIGDCNKLNLSGAQNAFGLIVGYNNRVNNHNANNIGGYNIIIGEENSGNNESINIGTQNDTVGHSIGLGWRNIANTNSYAHSILLGKDNYADTNRPELIPWSAQSGKYVRRVEDGDVVYKLENPETNNFVVGTNNSASHYNSIIIGSVNQTLSAVPNPEAEEGEEFNDDDGFTVAIGLGNIAARNYDMAIGYATLASGGENIAIGSPQMDADYDELLWHTNAVGYRNIAIRSNVSGIGNIAFESNFEGKGINNVAVNAALTIHSDSDDEYPFARNDVRYVTGSNNLYVSGNATNNIIRNTDFDIHCTEYFADNIIRNSHLAFEDGYDIAGLSANIILNNIIDCSYVSGETNAFRHNVILFSELDVTSDELNFSYSDANQNVCNFLVGTKAKNVVGTFSFDDAQYNEINETLRSFNFGGNRLNRACESVVMGVSNNVTNINHSYVFGAANSLYTPTTSTGYNLNETYILGDSNQIAFSAINDVNGRNRIFGNYNSIKADKNVTDSTIIGNNNKFAKFDTVPDKNGDMYFASAGNTYHSYRNVVIGSQNAVSQYISNSFIGGDYNIILTTDVSQPYGDESKFDSNTIFGCFNRAFNGSKQFIVGDHNTVSGHFGCAIGEELSAQDFQMIVGKYNAPVDKTVRSTSAKVGNNVVELPNSGILFAIGNGRLNAYEEDGYWYDSDGYQIDEFDEDYIERSNAMTVSANGTVSAGDFEISGCKLSDIIDVVTLLKNKPASGQPYIMGLDNSGKLVWMNV